jgi:hypothetical protein
MFGGLTKMKIPIGPEELTVEWLTEALRKRGTLKRGQVASCMAKVLGGTKGALGQIARLSLAYAPVQENAPRSLIAKFGPADPEQRMRLNWAGFYEREIRFYQELAGQVEFRTPDCHYSAWNAETGEFVLLLEDLAPARNGERAVGCSLKEADLAIREIAKFHAAWWQDPQLLQQDWLRWFSTPAVHQRWQDGYQQRWEIFVAKVTPHLPGPILTLGQQLGPKVAQVFEQFYHPPLTLIHNDYMLDNLFFATTGNEVSLAVVDWQFLTCGRGVSDVGSFLGGNVSIEDRRANELDLLRTYHTLLLENGVTGYPFAQCWDDYRFSMFDGLFRMVWAIGEGNLRDEQERAHQDIIWPRFCAALLDLNVAALLPE